MASSGKLSAQMEAFCQEYLKDPTQQRQAAIRAGYSPKTATQKAAGLMANPKVSNRIEQLMRERNKRVKMGADDVLRKLAEMMDADIIDILNDSGGIKPVSEWPPVWRKSISGFEVAELFEGRGEDREQIGYLKKIKLLDKIKVLELIGKHVDVAAFRDRVQVDVSFSLADKMAAARQRIANKKADKE
ncbi:terminase small subunit [Ewingella sp. AOP9-I1-14]